MMVLIIFVDHIIF